MHDTALRIGQLFLQHYAGPHARVLDVGAQDVTGSLRQFAPGTMTYVGVDLSPGKGVDIVLDDPHRLPFNDGSFDAVVTTSCYEHDTAFWLSFVEAVRVLRPGGHLYVSVPSNGPYHRYPVDCWRFYPDASLALVAWARRQGYDLELVESFIAPRSADMWNDYVAIFARPPLRTGGTCLADLLGGISNLHCPEKSAEILSHSGPTWDQRRIVELESALSRIVAAAQARVGGNPLALEILGILGLAEPQPTSPVLALLRTVLQRAESGEIQGVALATVEPNIGSAQFWASGEASFTQMAGAVSLLNARMMAVAIKP